MQIFFHPSTNNSVEKEVEFQSTKIFFGWLVSVVFVVQTVGCNTNDFTHAWCKETHLRFDVSLRLAHETIRPLIQFTRGRLVYLDVPMLVAPHLFGYVLVYKWTEGRQDEATDDEQAEWWLTFNKTHLPQSGVEKTEGVPTTEDFSPHQLLIDNMHKVTEKQMMGDQMGKLRRITTFFQVTINSLMWLFTRCIHSNTHDLTQPQTHFLRDLSSARKWLSRSCRCQNYVLHLQ